MILLVLILLYLTIPHHNTPRLHKKRFTFLALFFVPFILATVKSVIRKQANGVGSAGLFDGGKLIDRVGGMYEHND